MFDPVRQREILDVAEQMVALYYTEVMDAVCSGTVGDIEDAKRAHERSSAFSEMIGALMHMARGDKPTSLARFSCTHPSTRGTKPEGEAEATH